MLLLLLSLKCLFNEISLLILQIRIVVCRLPPDFADQTVIWGSKCADYTRQQFNSKYTWSALAIVRLLYSFDVCWKSCAILIDYYYRWSWWRRRSERRRSDWLLVLSVHLRRRIASCAVAIMCSNKGCSAASAGADGILRPPVYTRMTVYYSLLRTNTGQPATTTPG